MSQVVTGTVRAPAGLPLLFATDGAASRRPFNGVRPPGWRSTKPLNGVYLTGFGWLSTAGEWGVGYCPQPKAIAGRDRAAVAELRAVSHAVSELLPAGPVTVLLDSEYAARLLRGWAAGGREMPAGYVGSTRRTPMAHRLADLVAAHPTHLRTRWVRGHAGHLLNECADSLALLGLRWLAKDLPIDVVRARAEWLAAGFLADQRLIKEVA